MTESITSISVPEDRDSATAADGATTGVAPPYRALLPSSELAPGARVGDFELLHLLGEGAFAKVFLARQLSLGRLVALKVAADPGSEARTLARLEHDHIVQVFAEDVVPERGMRLLCMQYVPGTTLQRV